MEAKKDYTMAFVNCHPDLTETQLATLVCQRLDLPIVSKRAGRTIQHLKDGTVVELTSAQIPHAEL